MYLMEPGEIPSPLSISAAVFGRRISKREAPACVLAGYAEMSYHRIRRSARADLGICRLGTLLRPRSNINDVPEGA